MVTKQQKEQVVADLVSMLQGATSLYLLDYSTMTVAESNTLRSELRKKDLTFKVAKNRLIQRALAEVGGFEIPEDKFFGQTGIVCGYSDAIAPAKIIKEVSEKSEKPILHPRQHRPERRQLVRAAVQELQSASGSVC